MFSQFVLVYSEVMIIIVISFFNVQPSFRQSLITVLQTMLEKMDRGRYQTGVFSTAEVTLACTEEWHHVTAVKSYYLSMLSVKKNKEKTFKLTTRTLVSVFF